MLLSQFRSSKGQLRLKEIVQHSALAITYPFQCPRGPCRSTDIRKPCLSNTLPVSHPCTHTSSRGSTRLVGRTQPSVVFLGPGSGSVTLEWALQPSSEAGPKPILEEHFSGSDLVTTTFSLVFFFAFNCNGEEPSPHTGQQVLWGGGLPCSRQGWPLLQLLLAGERHLLVFSVAPVWSVTGERNMRSLCNVDGCPLRASVRPQSAFLGEPLLRSVWASISAVKGSLCLAPSQPSRQASLCLSFWFLFTRRVVPGPCSKTVRFLLLALLSCCLLRLLSGSQIELSTASFILILQAGPPSLSWFSNLASLEILWPLLSACSFKHMIYNLV